MEISIQTAVADRIKSIRQSHAENKDLAASKFVLGIRNKLYSLLTFHNYVCEKDDKEKWPATLNTIALLTISRPSLKQFIKDCESKTVLSDHLLAAIEYFKNDFAQLKDADLKDVLIAILLEPENISLDIQLKSFVAARLGFVDRFKKWLQKQILKFGK